MQTGAIDDYAEAREKIEKIVGQWLEDTTGGMILVMYVRGTDEPSPAGSVPAAVDHFCAGSNVFKLMAQLIAPDVLQRSFDATLTPEEASALRSLVNSQTVD